LCNRKYIRIGIKGVKDKITIRVKNRIDRDVISYVFFKQFHLPPKEIKIKNNPTLVDLGSNIGCTLIDLNNRYPCANIFGYEMDMDNFNLAKTNCEKFKNVVINNVAVWDKKGEAFYHKNNPTDAFSISEGIESENQERVQTVTISDIIRENNLKEIDYLKIDIEGSEIDIFDSSDLAWLDFVLSLNIEFHGISDSKLIEYINLLNLNGFSAYKSPYHWLSILAVKKSKQAF
jgi:FkbM family methyltransferase